MHLPALVDRSARDNRWAHLHPAEKAVAAAAGAALAVVHPWPGMAGVVTVLAVTAVRQAGVPWRVLAEAAVMPTGFLAAAALPLLFTLDVTATWRVGLSPAAWADAVAALSRAMAVTACSLGLALTTPVHDLAWLARRLGVAAPFVIAVLATYRFLFQFARTLSALHAAQRARLGFLGWTGRLRSASLIAAALFGQCLDGARALAQGLAARGGLSLGRGGFADVRPHRIAAILTATALLAFGGLA